MSGIDGSPATVARHWNLLLQQVVQGLDVLRSAGREGGVRVVLLRGGQSSSWSPLGSPLPPLQTLHLEDKEDDEQSSQYQVLTTTLVFLVPAGVLLPLWSARLGVSPPLSPALSSLSSDLSECFRSLPSPLTSPVTRRFGCLSPRPRSKVKAPSSQISRRGAEGEACLEVPAEEMRMSCFF